MVSTNSTSPAPAWLGSDSEQSQLRKHLATFRHRGWLIIVTVMLALAAAGVYVKTATPVYQATSSLLVSPVPTGGSIPSNISGLLYQSADPTRDIQTAATIVDSLTTARVVKRALSLPETPAKLLSKISVQPISDSNVLALTASASTANGAAELANEFARHTIAVRTAQLRASVDQQIAGLRASSTASGGSGTAGASGQTVGQQIAQLEALRSGSLPDMSVSALAIPPDGRTSPRASLSLAAGLVVGLVLGILGVLALEAFDLTLRREDQLKALFRLPILARVPDERLRRSWRPRRGIGPRTPDSFSFAALESFRTLRAMALASRSRGRPVPRSLLITSAEPGEGKTTTALNLASSLAASGASVILVEGDLRRPSIGRTLKLLAAYDVTAVLTGQASLATALVSSKRFPGVRFLLAEGIRSRGTSGDALFLPTAATLLEDAGSLADFVIVDSPPLLAVIDALELARHADSVLIVAHLGQTDLRRLSALGSLLAEAHVDPTGIALIGSEAPGASEAYGYQAQQGIALADAVPPSEVAIDTTDAAEAEAPRAGLPRAHLLAKPDSPA